MTEIDRRSLIGAAGVGLMLSGCATSEQEDNIRRSDNARKMFGVCPPFGDLPNLPSPFNKFEPEYIRVVYLKFDAGKMISLQGNVSLPNKLDVTDQELKSKVSTLIADLRKGSGWDKDNIDIVSCGVPLVLLIFIDNDKNSETSFADDKGGENIIRFTDQSGKYPFEERKMNKAFYDLHYIDFSDFGLGRSAYRMKFWSKDAIGQDINMGTAGVPNSYYLYSMNIHLKIPTQRAGSWVPMVIDPDTGNMGSKP